MGGLLLAGWCPSQGESQPLGASCSAGLLLPDTMNFGNYRTGGMHALSAVNLPHTIETSGVRQPRDRWTSGRLFSTSGLRMYLLYRRNFRIPFTRISLASLPAYTPPAGAGGQTESQSVCSWLASAEHSSTWRGRPGVEGGPRKEGQPHKRKRWPPEPVVGSSPFEELRRCDVCGAHFGTEATSTGSRGSSRGPGFPTSAGLPQTRCPMAEASAVGPRLLQRARHAASGRCTWVGQEVS